MKTSIYDIQGNKKHEVELPNLFSTKIREDIVLKTFEAEKFVQMHPYSPYKEAGRRHSASGTISHRRHEWKGHYGKGISRIPRKTMSRRGVQFYWVGAEISGTRGGRRAHPPKPNIQRKINKNEERIAMHSALASTANEKYISNRYSSLAKLHTPFPIIIESKLDKVKSKDFMKLLKHLLKDNYHLALKNKTIRAGKGKMRGRKYKSNAGVLLIKSSSENLKIKGIDIRSIPELKISNLYPLGRLAIFTEKALEELGGKK